jgi:prolyl-tRNA synthetase
MLFVADGAVSCLCQTPGMAKPSVLTPQSEDFPRWYQDVVAKAEMAENGASRGTMIIKPWGYALWERIQSEMDHRIKATGHSNVYFPMFIPMEFFQREAEHVEGFSPELAVVTHGGGKELAEPLAVRPTSETVIGDAMSRWVQGHRDLPLLLNQWANVVRWELRPRLFLRTTEFLWQEGHTAHATWDEAETETRMILHDVYNDVIRNVLAVPVVLGRKTAAEKFPGAETTYTLEGLMRDGKALQMGTSHNLGQNFARAFNIAFSDESGAQQHAWTTSWGLSTRVVGGLIMAHGDDAGLILPPAVAPIQVVILAIKDEALAACDRLAGELSHAGVRVQVDSRTHLSFGRRAVEWELKGVPLRIEVGPRDLEQGMVTLVRRDRDGKTPMSLEIVGTDVPGLLDDQQRALLVDAETRREAATADVADADQIDGPGFFRIPWESLGAEGEARLAERGYSVRCLVTPDGDVPAGGAEPDDRGLIAYVAKAY